MKLKALKLLFILMLVWIPISSAAIVNATATSAAATAQLEVCNGGILGLEGSYSTSLKDVHYGDTIYVRVSGETGYAILVDGVNKGEDKIHFHVDKSSGTITIETSPSTQTITLNVTGYNSYFDYIAGYFLFVKQNCPPLTNVVPVDAVLWALLIIPVGVAIGLKLGIAILRAIL